MRRSNILTRLLVLVLTIPLALPLSLVRAEAPALPLDGRAPLAALPAHDVALSADGQLRGMLVNATGQPVARGEVALVGAEGEVQRVTTDAEGRFAFAGLRGGTYQLVAPGGICVCRAWTAAAAPPQAKEQLLIVSGAAVRGQRPLGDLFSRDPLLITALVAAAIAIPIAIHKSRDDAPPGS